MGKRIDGQRCKERNIAWRHNFVINILIRSNSLIGLDLGCRQGGDLKKWFHCRIEHLYLIENDSSAMFECRRRSNNLKYSWSNFYNASFIQDYFTIKELKISRVVDVISSQMSIHRAFESKEKAEKMARNVSQTLKNGGYLVVSLTNASKILESLRKTPVSLRSFRRLR